MKIRKGFVSNSSSSSFMGGIGVVKDWEKFNSWIDKLEAMGVDKYEIPKPANLNGYDVEEDANKYVVILPVNDTQEVFLRKSDHETIEDKIPEWFKAKKLLTDNEYIHNIVVFEFSNNEGDSAFMSSDWGDLEYDIDIDWFDDKQRAVYDGFSEDNGIVFVDKKFGAGRNG